MSVYLCLFVVSVLSHPGAVLLDFRITDPENLTTPFRERIEYALPNCAVRAGNTVILTVQDLEYGFSSELALPARRYAIEYPTTWSWEGKREYRLPRGWSAEFTASPLEMDTEFLRFSGAVQVDPQAHRLVVRDAFQRKVRVIPAESFPAYRRSLERICRWSQNRIFLSVTEETHVPADSVEIDIRGGK